MLRLHEGQSDVYSDLFVTKSVRFASVNCSRGWGKSFMAATAAVTAIFELFELPDRVPNKIVYIVAPTHDQVTDIYYPLLNHDLGLENYALRSSRDLGRFWFPKNIELRLISYEAVERMRGKGAYFVVWDEVSSCLKGLDPRDAWESVIQPCIKTRWSRKRAMAYGAKSPGRALIISTPKGFNYFHTLCHMWENDPEWKYYHFDYLSSPFLDADEIQRDRANMDPVKFASEYLASFKESGSSVFYTFDRNIHVRRDIPDLIEDEPLHVCIDFNVGLQCSTLLAERGNQIHIFDQLKGHPDTEELAKTLRARFGAERKIFAYPDPSGRARKTSAPVGRTDFSILESYGITCLARPKAPPIVDSVACANRLLMNALGQSRMFVHPRALGVIESLERTKWVDGKPDNATIDKSEGVEHFSDGIRYYAEFRHPITAGTKVAQRGFGF
jgi:hypothetical protein